MGPVRLLKALRQLRQIWLAWALVLNVTGTCLYKVGQPKILDDCDATFRIGRDSVQGVQTMRSKNSTQNGLPDTAMHDRAVTAH